MEIKDGTGSGSSAKVSSENKLNVEATTYPKIYHVSEGHGQAFSWTNVDYNYDALDTILLVKNTGSNLLHVHHAIFYSDTTTVVHIHRPTSEVTPTGTTVTGVNLNGKSAHVAAASAIGDETNNTQGSIIGSFILPADTPIQIAFEDSILLATNQSIGFDYVTVGTAAIVTMVGFFHAED
jgi:hypothetical protein